MLLLQINESRKTELGEKKRGVRNEETKKMDAKSSRTLNRDFDFGRLWGKMAGKEKII